MHTVSLSNFNSNFFRHEAQRLDQEARGRLERQKINDEAEAEKARTGFLELQSLSAAVESTGQAKAEALSRAESSKIEGQAAVDQSRLKAEAQNIEGVSTSADFIFYTETFTLKLTVIIFSNLKG